MTTKPLPNVNQPPSRSVVNEQYRILERLERTAVKLEAEAERLAAAAAETKRRASAARDAAEHGWAALQLAMRARILRQPLGEHASTELARSLNGENFPASLSVDDSPIGSVVQHDGRWFQIVATAAGGRAAFEVDPPPEPDRQIGIPGTEPPAA